MIGRLALALERSGVDLDPVRLAEILWVATHGQGTGRTESELSHEVPEVEPGLAGEVAGAPPERAPGALPAADVDTDEPLYLVPRPVMPEDEPLQPAVEVRLPGPAALPGRLQLGRALRVLKRERPVSRVATLDLDATIRQYGDTGLLTPMMRPGAERWFDVALVVDSGPTMDVWAQTTIELTKLLENHGAFRRVRRWRLVEQSGEPWLLNDAGARHHVRQLAEPEGRQLTLVMTDCVGAQWCSSPIWSAIQDWGRHGPVVLVQPLPPRLWESTALGPVDVRLTGYRPGQSNRGLRITLPWWWTAEEQPTGAVPVIALTEPDVSRWARMVMGAAGVPVLGVIVEAAPPVDDAPTAELDPATRVALFRATVSPEAYQLAVCLAAVPVRLPIARIVQYGVLGSHDLVHLAEVFAGGLLRRVTPPGDDIPIDDVVYEFAGGVRELLQESLTGVRTLEIYRAVAQYLEAILGRPANFTALLTAAPNPDTIDKDFQPFAEIAGRLLDLLDLRQVLASAPITPPLLPPKPTTRTDPLPWAHAILVGDDKQIYQFRSWLTSPKGGGLPRERVFLISDPESLPHAVRDAAGTAHAEGRRPGVLFVLEYGSHIPTIGFEVGTEWSAFSGFVRVVVAAQSVTHEYGSDSPPIPSSRMNISSHSASVTDIIDGLSGQAEDHNGAITSVSLDHYLRRSTANRTIGNRPAGIVLRPGRPIPIANRRALVIGIDDTGKTSDVKSQHSVSDARALAERLREAGYHVALLTGHKVIRELVLRALNELVASSTDDDLLWVHISAISAEWTSGAGMTALVTYGGDRVSINDFRDLLAIGTSAAVVLTQELRWPSRSEFPDDKPAAEVFSMDGTVRESVRVSCLTWGDKVGARGPLVHNLHELLADPVEPATLVRLGDLADRVGRAHGPNSRVVRFYESDSGPSALLRANPPPADPVPDIEMIEIPAGPFHYGLSNSQIGELRGEVHFGFPYEPARKALTDGFAISRFPVTNAEYARFVAATGVTVPRHWDGKVPAREVLDHPVVWVGLGRARAYCAWLAEVTGRPYRLPTTTEWEKAARGSTDQRRFPWGDEFDPSRCAYRKRNTVPVQAYSPQGDSPYGVADLVGNTREWTNSLTGRHGASSAIVRGGGILADRGFQLWCSYFTEVNNGPKATIGFRVALD